MGAHWRGNRGLLESYPCATPGSWVAWQKLDILQEHTSNCLNVFFSRISRACYMFSRIGISGIGQLNLREKCLCRFTSAAKLFFYRSHVERRLDELFKFQRDTE
jgi:hypothetical protein